MNLSYNKSLYFFLLLLIPFISLTQEISQDSTETVAQDSTKAESSYIFLPAIYFTPETEWAGGIVFQYYFYSEKKDSLSRPSSLVPIVIYTQKKQIITELGFDLYFQKQNYHLYGQIGYQKFPNSFFGIGNKAPENEESYTPSKFGTSITFLKKIYSATHLGLQYEFEDSKLSGFDENGLINNTSITGKKGGIVSGFGIAADYDTRDNIYYATKGRFYHGSALFFGSLLGSDYSYNRYNIDLREYYSLYEDHIIVFQAYANFIDGNAPFYRLSQFGGSNLMRGYFEGRYRDKHSIVFQSEYRKHIWYKFGFVAFGGIGQVAPRLSNFRLNQFKYSAGIGIRFMIDDAEKLNLRFDYGIGKDTSGFYMHFTEAI